MPTAGAFFVWGAARSLGARSASRSRSLAACHLRAGCPRPERSASRQPHRIRNLYVLHGIEDLTVATVHLEQASATETARPFEVVIGRVIRGGVAAAFEQANLVGSVRRPVVVVGKLARASMCRDWNRL